LTSGTGALASALKDEENRTVKRNFLILAGVVAIGVTSFLRAQGQQQYNQTQQPIQQTGANTAAPLRTRVAVINLQSVIKQYQKWTAFETEYKRMYENYNQEFEKKKSEAAGLKAQYERTNDDQAKEAIQRQMRELDRQVQDMGEGAKKHLAKLRDDQASQIYNEVEMAVEAYARANDIEMVMHFNDAITRQDKQNPMNIAAKLQSRTLFPMYVAPGMDITDTVAGMLNQRLNAGSAIPGQQR
jgi:Skp family chaperone for outer membrane proteins